MSDGDRPTPPWQIALFGVAWTVTAVLVWDPPARYWMPLFALPTFAVALWRWAGQGKR